MTNMKRIYLATAFAASLLFKVAHGQKGNVSDVCK